MNCIENNCDKLAKSRNLCGQHYARYVRAGGETKKLEHHGMYYSREYKSWNAMKGRCLNTKTDNPKYIAYQKKGIKIYQPWVDSFMRFYQDMGPMPKGSYSLDRIDNDGDYTPKNCRWATPEQQAYNRSLQQSNTSGYRGISKCIGGWRASLMKHGVAYVIGTYKDIEQAAIAYDCAAIQLYGSDAKLNVVKL